MNNIGRSVVMAAVFMLLSAKPSGASVTLTYSEFGADAQAVWSGSYEVNTNHTELLSFNNTLAFTGNDSVAGNREIRFHSIAAGIRRRNLLH